MFEKLQLKIVGLVVGAAAIVASGYLALQLGKAHGTIKGLRADLVSTNAGWNQCKTSLVVSNAQRDLATKEIADMQGEVERWRTEAATAKTLADRLVANARADAAQYRAEARAAANADVNGDHCTWALNMHQIIIGRERGR